MKKLLLYTTLAFGLSLIGYNAQSGIVTGKETLFGNGDDQGCSTFTGCVRSYKRFPNMDSNGNIRSNCDTPTADSLIGKKGYTASYVKINETCGGTAERYFGAWVKYSCGTYSTCTESKMEDPEE